MAYQRITLATLKQTMLQRWDQSVFWTDEEARLALNETLRDWNLLTGTWRRTITLSTVAATHELSLGATMVYGMRVKNTGAAPLHPTSLLELDLGRPTWRGETVASGGAVPTVPLLWAPVSLQQIVIWPATAGGVADLTADGVSNTPVLSEDADFIDLGDEQVDILVDMALHVAAFKEAGPRWRATRPYYVTFLQEAAKENGLLKANQKYRRAAGFDQRRRMQPAKDALNLISDIALKVAGDQT